MFYKMAKTVQEIRQERFEKGLCTRCGLRPPTTDKCCQICLDNDNVKREARRTAYKNKGLCASCGLHPSVSTKLCQVCLDKKKKVREESKIKVFEHYGNYMCSCCKANHPDILTLEHLSEDGEVYRKSKKIGTGDKLYGYLIRNNFPPDFEFEVLCINCSQSKKANNGICEHKL